MDEDRSGKFTSCFLFTNYFANHDFFIEGHSIYSHYKLPTHILLYLLSFSLV